MKSEEFLDKKLKETFEMFSDVKDLEIKYEHNKENNSHIIEISPLSFYNKNNKFMVREMDIEQQFQELYPKETILFVTEKSLTKVTNPHLTL